MMIIFDTKNWYLQTRTQEKKKSDCESKAEKFIYSKKKTEKENPPSDVNETDISWKNNIHPEYLIAVKWYLSRDQVMLIDISFPAKWHIWKFLSFHDFFQVVAL